jgi:hypothetical protein
MMLNLDAEVKALQEEFKALTIDVHQLQRQQSSKRGPEGARGPAGANVKGDRGDKGDPGIVSKEQALAMFREVIHEHDNEFVKEIVKVVRKDFSKMCQEILDDLEKAAA